jgi:hypothetical protein
MKTKEKNWEKGFKEFSDRLTEELEKLFPKTNQDNPEIPSRNNRTTALVFNALANIIFKDVLKRALFQQRQEIVEEIDKIYKKEESIHHWLDLREKLLNKN